MIGAFVPAQSGGQLARGWRAPAGAAGPRACVRRRSDPGPTSSAIPFLPADWQLHERQLPDRSQDRVIQRRRMPSSAAYAPDADRTTTAGRGSPGDLIQLIAIGVTDDEHVDVVGNRAWLTLITCGPRAVYIRRPDTSRLGQQVREHRQWPVRNGEQVGQGAADGCSGRGPQEANVATSAVAHETGRDETGRLGMYSLDAHADQVSRLGQAVVTVGMQIEQGEQVTLGTRPEQRQQRRG